ncbi:MAG: hypothetical protein AAFR67_08890, partial [Chloroflexota bacterium]
FIFWMERYIALSTMDIDDLQGQQWIQELSHSPARKMLARSLTPQIFSRFPEQNQHQIIKLLPSLLFASGSPLQKRFFAVLVQK